jgi:hypothetical protein
MDLVAQRVLLRKHAVAAALAAHHRRPVRVFHVTDDDYYNEWLGAGMPAAAADLLTGFDISVRTGLMQVPLGIPTNSSAAGRPACRNTSLTSSYCSNG